MQSTKALPETIPAPEGSSATASPLGLFFNELVHCPEPLVATLPELLDKALDFDTGNYQVCMQPPSLPQISR